MSAIGDLLDVNVWLAYTIDGHPLHAAALDAWGSLRRPAFCRVTQLGWLRLVCNPKVMGAAVLTPSAAWTAYAGLESGGEVCYVDEPAGLVVALEAFVRGAQAARDLWTDAYLAAFAKTAGMRVVTFDGGFRKFKGVDCLILTSGA